MRMKERKKIVAVDMDDTILKLMRALMEDHNKAFPEAAVAYEDLIAFDESNFHPDYNKFEYFDREGTFFNLEIMDEYVVEEMRKINEKYDLIIVTSARPASVPDKWKWIQKHLPFISHNNFITISRKDLIRADILIDDAIHNVKPWVEKGKPAIVPIHHWNKELIELKGVTPIYGWHGVTEIISNILGD